MIPPGALVMLSPVVVGVLFGTKTLAGLLAGALISGVQMAVSMSNTGGAWDNAKKYVEVSGPSGSPAQTVLRQAKAWLGSSICQAALACHLVSRTHWRAQGHSVQLHNVA